MSLSHRPSLLRAAVVALGVTGAVLAPATAALATDEPTRPATEAKPEPTTAPEEGADRDEAAEGTDRTPAKPEPTRAPEDATIPRGGVAAGERPASPAPGSDAALYGTAAGTVLLAGAGTYVLRRRAGAQHNG